MPSSFSKDVQDDWRAFKLMFKAGAVLAILFAVLIAVRIYFPGPRSAPDSRAASSRPVV